MVTPPTVPLDMYDLLFRCGAAGGCAGRLDGIVSSFGVYSGSSATGGAGW